MLQEIKLKLRSHNKWETIALPPVEECTAALFETWADQPCIIEFADVHRKYYAYGNDDVAHYVPEGQIIMDMGAFCQFWRMKLLEFGIDTFSKVELADERRDIMTVEGESADTIAAVIASRPDLYTQPDIWPEDF
jgi:hypothetical protein